MRQATEDLISFTEYKVRVELTYRHMINPSDTSGRAVIQHILHHLKNKKKKKKLDKLEICFILNYKPSLFFYSSFLFKSTFSNLVTAENSSLLKAEGHLCLEKKLKYGQCCKIVHMKLQCTVNKTFKRVN